MQNCLFWIFDWFFCVIFGLELNLQLSNRWNISRYVLCALEPGCMSPEPFLHYTKTCHRLAASSTNFSSNFSGCHRFDQSILNLLLANANNFMEERYTPKDFAGFFTIQRNSHPNSDTVLHFCPNKSINYEKVVWNFLFVVYNESPFFSHDTFFVIIVFLELLRSSSFSVLSNWYLLRF